ncbi:hypothetical protein GC209_17805 [bacterium]|nr:hypothetical protein [bacterium]
MNETSGNNLPGTASPTAVGDISRAEAFDATTGNGFAKGYSYDQTADTFTVDNLAFDGGNVYQRATRPGGAKMTISGAKVYAGSGTYPDTVTHTLIDQFSYRALYGVSTSGNTNFAIVRTGAYRDYGFGGFIYNRIGGVTLPTTGQANYEGTYAGLRDFSGASGLQITSGTAHMAIDFNDFNPDTSATGNGAGITGYVDNRKIFDLNGKDITADVIAGINADKKPDTPLVALPTMVFKVGPGNLDNNGEMQGQLDNTITINGTPTVFEAGKYYAVLSGDATAGGKDEVAGVIVVTSQFTGYTARETGGFILYRK